MPGVSDFCTVLSHELRTPLTVLQGYLRLLQRGPASGNTAHVAAMLDATAQLALLGRQASELAAWLHADHPNLNASVPVSTFLARLREAATGQHVEVSSHLTGDAASMHVAIDQDADRLERAIVTMATAVLREAEAPRALVHVSADSNNASEILVHLQADGLDRRPSMPSDTNGDRPWFLNGGFGLALVGAAIVCDAHGARVAWGGPSRPTIVYLRTHGAA